MQTHTNLFLRSSLVAALALTIWAPTQVFAAEHGGGKPMTESKGMAGCQEMKEEKKKMKEDMKVQNAALTEQLAKMNSAPENQKVALMAAFITTTTEQRIAMDARKAKMHEKMMQHMMEHMQGGAESMAQCPMMKNQNVNAEGTHQDHLNEAAEN